MERIYVSISYLKTFHYLFFSLAVFSLTSGMMLFTYGSFESLSFFGLTAFYCTSSLIVAHYFYKNYREVAEPIRIIKIYLLPYIVLVFWTIGSISFLVIIFPVLLALIYSFLFINYYIFFLIIIGFFMSRFRMVSKFFEVYNFYILGKARKLAKQYACEADVGEYEVGSDPKIDEMLDDIWAHKAYPIPYVRRVETALCEKHIIDINRMLEAAKDRNDPKERATTESLKLMKDDYMRKIRAIEQKKD